MNNTLSSKTALWFGRMIFAGVCLLALTLPGVLDWYQTRRPLGVEARRAILWGYYFCVPGVLYALWSLEKILGNILKTRVFVEHNVRCLRHLRWCCGWVGAVSLAAGVFYPPLLFLAVIMAFLALVVSVVKNVMAAAVELREENDLTV